MSFCERAKPSTVTASAVMELVGTVLYCPRFVCSLYSDLWVEVKPRSLINTDLLSTVGESCKMISFCWHSRDFPSNFLSHGLTPPPQLIHARPTGALWQEVEEAREAELAEGLNNERGRRNASYPFLVI